MEIRNIIIKILSFFAILNISLPCGADELSDLQACVGTDKNGMVKRLAIHDLKPMEMVVISDCNLPNTALNPNLSYNKVDVAMSRKVVYVQNAEGTYGIKLLFAHEEFNELHLFDRVLLDLNGCRIASDVATGAITVDGLTPSNVIKVTPGAPVPAKVKKISELNDSDIYTLVTLKDVEFVFREAAIVNLDERFCQYSPELHGGISGAINGYADGACCPIRDADGNSIFMAVNTLCPWRRKAAPLGSGDLTVVVCWECNMRYGDKKEKMYIRPLDEKSINISDSRKTARWKTYVGWFPARMPGDNFDFEKAGNTNRGVDDRLLNNYGPKSYLWTDSGERRIQKAGSFNSLPQYPNGYEQGGSIKLYGNLNTWYDWNADGSVANGKSIFVEFNTKKLKASALQFCFEISGGDANILNTRGLPVRWQVSCRINDGPEIILDEAGGSDTFGLRPVPAEDKYDSKYKKTYCLMYASGIGMQGHAYNLPASAIGAERVVMRITPSEPRWFHLSGNPARDVEYPDAKTNLVNRSNKIYSTVRLGTVFIDYKPL